MYNEIRSTIDACLKPVVLKKNWPVSRCSGAYSCFPKWRSVVKTGQHACERIDDRQQVSEGGHFMELLVS